MVNPTDMSVFSALKARLDMLGERQKVIAENVANVSTPGYNPKDVDMDGFAQALRQSIVSGSANGSITTTNERHIAGPSGAQGRHVAVTTKSSPDSETTLDGNAVVVEEQMMKIAETRMDFETMVGLYQKSLGLLRMASRGPR